MLNFKFAHKNNLNEIKNIWKTCFLEPIENAEFFISRNFTDTNCAICLSDEKIVSMLFLLKIQLYTKKGLQTANYIYAAATLPDFRNQGLMGKLLNFANNESLKKNTQYSVLLPATSSLYNFYEKYGYKKFFKTRILKLSQNEVKAIIENQKPSNSFDNLDEVYNIRQKFFNHIGNVILPKQFLKYAIDMNNFYGGQTFCCRNGYAIVRRSHENTEILELCCKKGNIPELFAKIYSEFKTPYYTVRLSGNDHNFSDKGKLKDFGMIKSLSSNNENLSNILQKNLYPYLGLALD